jgi:transcriptional regulator with XRE-family HTH domain
MNLSQTLRFLMQKTKITEYALSKRTGVPQPMINKILHEKNTNPKIATLQPLANYFMVTMSQLLGEDTALKDKKLFFVEETHLETSHIPILEWQKILDVRQSGLSCTKHQKYIPTNANISSESYALVVEDSTMEPRFLKNSIVIVDPSLSAYPNNYVVLYLADHNKCCIRKVVLHDNYLCILEINSLEILALSQDDQICGIIVESRNVYT